MVRSSFILYGGRGDLSTPGCENPGPTGIRRQGIEFGKSAADHGLDAVDHIRWVVRGEAVVQGCENLGSGHGLEPPFWVPIPCRRNQQGLGSLVGRITLWVGGCQEATRILILIARTWARSLSCGQHYTILPSKSSESWKILVTSALFPFNRNSIK